MMMMMMLMLMLMSSTGEQAFKCLIISKSLYLINSYQRVFSEPTSDTSDLSDNRLRQNSWQVCSLMLKLGGIHLPFLSVLARRKMSYLS